MSKFARRLAALFVSAAVLFTIGSASAADAYDAVVDYVESTGANYVNMGLALNGASHTVVLRYAYTDTTSGGYVFGNGAYNNGSTYLLTRSIINGEEGKKVERIQFYCNSSMAAEAFNFPIGEPNTDIHEVVVGPSKIKIDGLSVVPFQLLQNACPNNAYIFASDIEWNQNAAGSFSRIRLYGLQVYEGTTLKKDFRPVRVGQVGRLYERVSGTLCATLGTGDLVAGADSEDQTMPARSLESTFTITRAAGYTLLESVETTGNQYFPIDFTHDSTSRLLLKYNFTDTTSGGVLYGSSAGGKGRSVVLSRGTPSGGNETLVFNLFNSETSQTPYTKTLAANTAVHTAEISSEGYFLDGEKLSPVLGGFSGICGCPNYLCAKYCGWPATFNGRPAGQSNIGTSPVKAQIYSCQLYKGGNLIRDLVPVNTSIGPGLWDKVENRFHKPILVDNVTEVIAHPFAFNPATDFVVDTNTEVEGLETGAVTVEAGTEISAPETAGISELERGRCIGYKIYLYDSESQQYVEQPERASDSRLYTVIEDDVGAGVKLEWQWLKEQKITIAADAADGSYVVNDEAPVSGDGTFWGALHGTFKVVFTPAGADVFRRLDGVPTDAVYPSVDEVNFIVDGPRDLTLTTYPYEDENLVAFVAPTSVTTNYDVRIAYTFSGTGALQLFAKRTLTAEDTYLAPASASSVFTPLAQLVSARGELDLDAVGVGGTAVATFVDGDVTADRFVFEPFEAYPLVGGKSEPKPVISVGGETLTEQEDYTLAYESNTVAGDAKVVVIGQGGYQGRVQVQIFKAVAVRFVTPDGTGDGSTWAAASSLADALAGLSGESYEIWCKAGNYPISSTLTIANETVIRGGLAADDLEPAKKAVDGTKSSFDGNHTLAIAFNSTYESAAADFLKRRVKFVDCALVNCLSAFKRTGVSALAFENCDFLNNYRDAQVVGADDGNAVTALGSAKSGKNAPVTFVNCQFLGNWRGNNNSSGGCGVVRVTNAELSFENCLFETNGIHLATWPLNYVQSGGFSTALVYQNGGSLTIRNCSFRGNVGTANYSFNPCFIDFTGTDFLMDHCAFVGNEVTRYSGNGIAYRMLRLNPAAGYSAVLRSCTFAYNISDTTDFSFVSRGGGGSGLIENCIFWGNRRGPTATHNREVSMTAGDTIRHSVFPSTEAGVSYSTGLNLQDVKAADPCFVSGEDPLTALFGHRTDQGFNGCMYFDPAKTAELMALDVHLLSPAGYRKNGDATWYTDTEELSSAIDWGDPASPLWENEPSPNGSRLNAGVYGGTAEASKTVVSEPAVEAVSVTFPDGYTQPHVAVTMGGEGIYNAQITVAVSVNGKDWIESAAFPVKYGSEVEWIAPQYFEPGVMLSARVLLNYGGTVTTKPVSPVEVTGVKPPWCDVLGLANVVYLREGATGTGTGDNWMDACATVHAALSRLQAAGKDELWIAGTLTMDPEKNNSSYGYGAKKVTLRGGFAGFEATLDARQEGAVSTIDGVDVADGPELSASKEIVVERLVFTRGYEHGLKMSVAGAAITNCVFSKNGATGVAADGRGLYVSSNGQNGNKVILSNCVFSENIQTNATDLHVNGRASYFSRCNVHMDDCLFVSNGIPFTASTPRGTANGLAVYLSDSSLRATGCRFIANRAQISGNEGGGVVYAAWQDEGAARLTYAFTNCLFLANEMLGGVVARNTGAGGVVFIGWQTGFDAEAVNCTFAYNLSEYSNTGAGFSAPGGKSHLVVKNSIFHGNVNRSGINADINMYNATSAEVTYNYFDSTNNIYGLANTATKVFANNIYGVDPGLISTTNDFFNLVKPTVTQVGWRYLDWTQPEKIMSLNVHLRGKGGYIDETTGEKVAGSGKTSPCVDKGDPKSDWRRETRPAGHRVNLGYYGNTPYQTQTVTGGVFSVR